MSFHVCWEPESSQLNSPNLPRHSSFWKRKAAPAAAEVRTQPLRDRTALPRGHRGAGRVHGDNRDTEERTPPPAQKTRRDSPAQSGNQSQLPPLAHLSTPGRKHSDPLEQSLRAQRSGGSPDLFASQVQQELPAFCTSLRVLHAVWLYRSKVQTGHITVKQINKNNK